MSENSREISKMSCVSFCQSAMRQVIAPKATGSVKERITLCARRLKWPVCRVESVWYADPRTRVDGEELADIERLTGHHYVGKELAENDELERRITTILNGENSSLRSLLAAAIREALGADNRS